MLFLIFVSFIIGVQIGNMSWLDKSKNTMFTSLTEKFIDVIDPSVKIISDTSEKYLELEKVTENNSKSLKSFAKILKFSTNVYEDNKYLLVK